MIAWCIICLKAWHLCDCCDVAVRQALSATPEKGV